MDTQSPLKFFDFEIKQKFLPSYRPCDIKGIWAISYYL